jgi:hypothetical protein
MTALGAIKTNWAAKEIVTADDINRIEGNIEYCSAPPAGVVANTTALATSMSSASYAVIGTTTTVVTNTGRVLVTGLISIEATSAAAYDMSITVTWNGNNIATPAPLARGSWATAATGWLTIPFSMIVTGLTPGASLTWDVRYLKNSGTSPVGRWVRLSVVDI